jgi:hypothetical protein
VITPAGDVLAADAPVVAKAPQTGADTLPVIGLVREIVLVGCPRVCRGPAYYQRVDLPRVLTWVR